MKITRCPCYSLHITGIQGRSEKFSKSKDFKSKLSHQSQISSAGFQTFSERMDSPAERLLFYSESQPLAEVI